MVELLGVLAVVGGFGATALWLAVTRGTALRERDRYEVAATATDLELQRCQRKLAAQDATIATLADLAVTGGDPRNALAALRLQLLQEAEGGAGTGEDKLRADSEAAAAAGVAGLSKRRGLLGRLFGGTGGGVHDPSGPVDEGGGEVS